MIKLYYHPSPNPAKVALFLEEAQLPYEIVPIDTRKGEQHAPAFLKINPNAKTPALVDGDVTVFDSTAILFYLAEKTGLFLPAETKARSEVIQWLMWQMGGLGPMQGQANVFHRYFPERIASVTQRYQDETKRLFGVMDRRLADRPFLAGDYSIADMACLPWVRQHDWSGVSIDDLPNLKRWLAEVSARPAVIRGLNNPPAQVQPDVATGRAIVTGGAPT